MGRSEVLWFPKFSNTGNDKTRTLDDVLGISTDKRDCVREWSGSRLVGKRGTDNAFRWLLDCPSSGRNENTDESVGLPPATGQ